MRPYVYLCITLIVNVGLTFPRTNACHERIFFHGLANVPNFRMLSNNHVSISVPMDSGVQSEYSSMSRQNPGTGGTQGKYYRRAP